MSEIQIADAVVPEGSKVWRCGGGFFIEGRVELTNGKPMRWTGGFGTPDCDTWYSTPEAAADEMRRSIDAALAALTPRPAR